MLGAALLQHWQLTYKPYVREGEETSWYKALLSALNVTHLQQDCIAQIRHCGKCQPLSSSTYSKWVTLFLPLKSEKKALQRRLEQHHSAGSSSGAERKVERLGHLALEFRMRGYYVKIALTHVETFVLL